MRRKELECVACGLTQTIQRRNSRDKASGHIKHLWCPKCLKRTPHVEQDEFAQQFEKNAAGGNQHGTDKEV